ncbi:MAG: hypothetical protein NZ750_11855 [Anaerolineae bacterium]|nr:hypothetical protein [Anaerolineae bacterium]MDW8173944.1 hypothetical protein [Anaerolineae bacterium]
MSPLRIIPTHALILRYDILPGMQEAYFRYVVGEFVPSMQEMKLYMQEAWQIAYGAYPERQVEFITDDLDNIRRLLTSERWGRLEERLKDFVQHYDRRIVRYQGRFKI